MLKNKQEEKSIQSQINFQQKKRIFGANIANNLPAGEKQSNFQKKAAILAVENTEETNLIDNKNLKIFALPTVESNINQSGNYNSNQAESNNNNIKAFVFDFNNKNKNKKKKFLNKKTNKNEKSNSSGISAKNAGSAEGSAFLGWINHQNKCNKAKNKASKNNLSNNFNPNTSAFELVKIEGGINKCENSFAESDKENFGAEKNDNNCFVKGFRFKSKNLRSKENPNENKENNKNHFINNNFNNNKYENNKNNDNNKKNKLPEELNSKKSSEINYKVDRYNISIKENVFFGAPQTCRNDYNYDTQNAFELIESEKAKSICNLVSYNRMDIISDDNSRKEAIRVSSKSIQTSSKERKLLNKDEISNQSGFVGNNLINPFGVNNFYNAACSINLNNNINEAKSNGLCQQQTALEYPEAGNKSNNTLISSGYVFSEQPQQQIKSTILNYNTNSSSINNNNILGLGYCSRRMLNRENSVILNKNKYSLNTSNTIQNPNSNPHQVYNCLNNNNNELINGGNQRICAIHQQQINLNASKNHQNQSQINNTAIENIDQKQIHNKEGEKMKIENQNRTEKNTAQETISRMENPQIGQTPYIQLGNQRNINASFTFNPHKNENNITNLNNIFNNNMIIANNNNNMACFEHNQQINPTSVFSMNPALHVQVPNNCNNSNNDIPYFFHHQQNSSQLNIINNYARHHSGFGLSLKNYPLNMQPQNANNILLNNQNSFSAINNNGFNNLNSGYTNLNHFLILNNQNINLKYNYAASGMINQNNFAGINNNHLFAYQNFALNANLAKSNKNSKGYFDSNSFQIHKDNQPSLNINSSFQNPNLNHNLVNANGNSNQISFSKPSAQSNTSFSSSKTANLKENKKSPLCIDTKMCNENFENQIQLQTNIQAATVIPIASNNTVVQTNNSNNHHNQIASKANTS